uniref:putative barnase/colicin E5 family endoribonuclease n=1 Tax=uncultured Helicobacter sp. TaxID=175537 RepID=UPI00374E4E70
MQNPSIEFALQEFSEFSKAELEEMLTKGIRGEVKTKEGITKQDIEYIKDNTRYRGEIANYRDEELGMYGDTFHLAKLQKIENVIDPTNWEASLKTLLDKALTLAKDKDTIQQAQDLMDSIHLNNPSFFTPLNPSYTKIKEIVNEYQERLNTLIAQSPQDIKFIDTKGKEHTLSKDTQEQWLQTFGLQNLEQSYIPKHSQEIQQALGGKEIRLQKGSLLKLVSQGREQYIPQIKEVLDNPEAIIRDKVGDYLLLKHLKDDDYFVNVSFDNGEYLVSISNGFKETNNLQNKLKNGGEIIYQSPNANSILQTLLQTSRYSANTIDKNNSTIKNTNPTQNTPILHNPSIPTPQELQIQVSKAKADIDELMKNPQIVDKQWLYAVHKPQEVGTIQAHYFNQEIPQEYQEIIAPFPKLREQEIADTLKQHTQTQLKQTSKEQFLETFKDKPFEKTRTQASNLLKTYYEHNPKGLGVEIKDWNFDSANFKMALAKFQTKLKKGDEEVFETLWEAKFAKDIQDKRQEIQNLFDIKPIKEFGTNYAEFYKDGKGAIQKLLTEAKDYETRKEAGSLTEDEVKQGAYKGQVAGAFYKEGLGDIDLVWGDSKMGLAHILERRMQDFIEKGFSKAEAEQKTLEFAKSLPDIIENGNIDKRIARAFLETQDSKAVIALDFNDKDNKWILTAYNKDDALNPAYSHQVKHNTNTSSETRASGDKEIIPQNANTINILKDMQDKGYIPNEIRGDTANLSAYSDEFNPLLTSSDEPLTKQKNTLPLNSKEDSTIKEQSKQHKGQEELKNIFDEFEQ